MLYLLKKSSNNLLIGHKGGGSCSIYANTRAMGVGANKLEREAKAEQIYKNIKKAFFK